MTELTRSDTFTKAFAAAQEKAATVPSREDDDDDRTVHGLPEENNSQTVIDTSMFDVFTDFDLDLTCLSRPGSPLASTSELPPATPSPPASPPLSPILSHSISFMSEAAPPVSTTVKKSSKKSSSQQLHSQTVPEKKTSRGSWPLIRYAGRGTPIDRNRRLEWGGFSSENVVAEDGVLFSAVRSTSLDSAIRPSIRSASPDWSTSRLASSISHSNHSVSEHHSSLSSHRLSSVDSEPPPEIAPIQGLGTDKTDEWDSIMKTVLSSSSNLQLIGEVDTSAVQTKVDSLADGTSDPAGGAAAGQTSAETSGAVEPPQLTPEQLAQLNNGLEIDLGLDAALDLGLGQRGGMNWFNLGLLPQSARASVRARSPGSGRESPSVYSSQAATPRVSVHEDTEERRSPTSTKTDVMGTSAGADPENPGDLKFTPPSWWQKVLLRIRRVHTIIVTHTHRH